MERKCKTHFYKSIKSLKYQCRGIKRVKTLLNEQISYILTLDYISFSEILVEVQRF